jgi:hypothetical protein
LWPVQATSARTSVGSSAAGNTLKIESKSNIDFGVWKRMILLRE